MGCCFFCLVCFGKMLLLAMLLLLQLHDFLESTHPMCWDLMQSYRWLNCQLWAVLHILDFWSENKSVGSFSQSVQGSWFLHLGSSPVQEFGVVVTSSVQDQWFILISDEDSHRCFQLQSRSISSQDPRGPWEEQWSGEVFWLMSE